MECFVFSLQSYIVEFMAKIKKGIRLTEPVSDCVSDLRTNKFIEELRL